MWQQQDNSDRRLKALVQSAREGDRKAFAEIYENYFSPLYRYIFFRVRKKEDADDLTQTVFTKALGSIENFTEQGSSIEAWLYTIARNQTIDYWKKKKDIIVDDPAIFFDSVESNIRGPESVAQGKEAVEVVRKAIALLTEDQQEVVILNYIEGLSFKEIAQIMNKSQEAVRALKHRAGKALKEVINEIGYEINE